MDPDQWSASAEVLQSPIRFGRVAYAVLHIVAKKIIHFLFVNNLIKINW